MVSPVMAGIWASMLLYMAYYTAFGGVSMESDIAASAAVIAAPLSYLFGGFDHLFEGLLVMMLLDVVTGFVAAGVYHKSRYTSNGVSSNAMLTGLARKFCELCLVCGGVVLDHVIGTTYIRNAVITYILATEGLSLLENLSNMGVPFPAFLTHVLDVIREQTNKGDEIK